MTTTPLATTALAAADRALFAAGTDPTSFGGRVALVLLLLAASSGAWWIVRRRAARFRPVRSRAGATGHPPAGRSMDPALTPTDLGADLGTRATFVQFSAETCASCPQVRRALTSLAGSETGVVHVELAAEDHMDLVRRLSVFRTPTVLLLDAAGLIHARTSGPLPLDRALAALASVPHTGSARA